MCRSGELCWISDAWTARRSNQSILKETIHWMIFSLKGQNTHWKDWCWSWNSSTSATWCEEPTHWKRPWCWERLRAGGEGDDRGWGAWMASLTQSTWVWASSGRWWRTRRPFVLQSMGCKESDTIEPLTNNWCCPSDLIFYDGLCCHNIINLLLFQEFLRQNCYCSSYLAF